MHQPPSLLTLALFSLLLFFCCQQKPAGERSFCYWKTSFEITPKEDSLLNKLKVQHLYLRYFDVDWNPAAKKALPVASINRWEIPSSNTQKVTPSIYITNKVLEKLNREQLVSLAANIRKRTNQITRQNSESFEQEMVYKYRNDNDLGYDELPETKEDSLRKAASIQFNDRIKEILIDCDWSVKTKDNYFYLLEQLKPSFPEKKLAATVRLWQYKNPKLAGTPPVDRSLLMCYNLENPSNYKVENSIATIEELKKYVDKKSYGTPIDLALPIFSWAQLFRAGKHKGIISSIKHQDCLADTASYEQISENRFTFKDDRIIGDTYVRRGDELRIERITPEDLGKMTSFLRKNLNWDEDSRLTFFSWDLDYINDYTLEEIDRYYRAFGI